MTTPTPVDPIVDLVRTAIGYGVLMVLEDQATLRAELAALPANGTLADALTTHAEGLITTRRDLIEAVEAK